MATNDGWVGVETAEERRENAAQAARRAAEAAKAEADAAAMERTKAAAKEVARREGAELAEVLDADKTVVRGRQTVEAARQSVADIRAALQKAQQRVDALSAPTTADALKAAKGLDVAAMIAAQKKEAGERLQDLAAAIVVRDGLRGRLADAEAALAEAESELLRAERVALHHEVDRMIAEMRPGLQLAADHFERLRRFEWAIRDRHGQRQAFATNRQSEALRHLAGRWEKEIAETRQFSERYE